MNQNYRHMNTKDLTGSTTVAIFMAPKLLVFSRDGFRY